MQQKWEISAARLRVSAKFAANIAADALLLQIQSDNTSSPRQVTFENWKTRVNQKLWHQLCALKSIQHIT